jgi:Putative prokaryotic signal transducing protein
MARRDDEEWVEVASTGQDEEAALIKGLLESEEIPCEVEGPSGGSPWPENLGAFGMSRVLVPPERAAEARALLERREKEFRDENPDSDNSDSGKQE